MTLTGYEPGFCSLIALLVYCLSLDLWTSIALSGHLVAFPSLRPIQQDPLPSITFHCLSLLYLPSLRPFQQDNPSQSSVFHTPHPGPCCNLPSSGPSSRTHCHPHHCGPTSTLGHLDPQNAHPSLSSLPHCCLCSPSSHIQLSQCLPL